MKNRVTVIGRSTAACVLVLAVGVVVASCDDDNSSSGGPSKGLTTKRPEDVKVPLADVQAKLPGIIQLGNEALTAAQKGNWDGAHQSFESLQEVWYEVEGTVGDKDRNLYERIETAQGLISDGTENKNLDRVRTGANDQTTAIQQWLNTYK